MINDCSPVDKVLGRLEDYSGSGEGYRARCPAHNGNSDTSLSIKQGDDGRAVLYCHGGCDFKEIVDALGLSVVDLFAHDNHSSNGPTGKKATKKPKEKTLTWDDLPDGTYWEFTSPAGEVLYMQRHKREYYRRVGDDLWKSGLEGVTRVLYKLHEVVDAVWTGKTVYHFEGPKDVETAREKLGVVATTSGGVKTWRAEFRSHYTGANVVIVPDNDAEGRQYADTVAQSIAPVAQSVKVVDLPELPEKGDLTDWLDAGHTAEEFFSVVEAAPIYGNDNNDNDFEDLNELPVPCGFPLSALPPSVRQFVREGAASIGCPRDFVGVSVLAALSAAIGDTRRLVIKRDWLEGPCLYTMIIGPPASKKSPAMKLALRPVRDKQMKLKASHEIAKAAYKAEEIDTKPVLRRSYVDDVTVERLADIFNENPRGVLVAKDELAGWLGSMNQYKAGGKGGDRQKWLSIHTNEAIAVDRKSTDEPCIVPRPFASILGGIQPRVLPDFGNDRGDGLIDRFLPAYPDPVVSEWSDAEVSDDAWIAYTETINRLYNLNHVEYEDDLFPSKVHMTEEAKALFVATYNALQQESASPGFPQRLQDAWGKLAGHLGRLALILAMTRIAELERKGVRVGEEIEAGDMKGAIELLWYFKNHLRRMFTGLYGDSPSDRLAADLRDFLVDNGGTWEGIASELYEALNSEYKPEREKELGKLIRSIAKRSSLLHIEDLQRTQDRRPFRIILRNIGGNELNNP